MAFLNDASFIEKFFAVCSVVPNLSVFDQKMCSYLSDLGQRDQYECSFVSAKNRSNPLLRVIFLII